MDAALWLDLKNYRNDELGRKPKSYSLLVISY